MKILTTRLSTFLKILKRRKVPALAAFAIPLIAVVIYILAARAKYEATGQVILETSLSEQSLGFMPESFNKSNDIANEIERIKSHEVIDNAVATAKTMGEGVLAGPQPTYDEIANNLSISNLERTDIINISIVSYSSERAAALANLVMDSYINVHLMSSRNEARSVREFIGGQVSEYEKRLLKSENAVEEFKKESGTVSLQEETDLLVRNLADFDKKAEEIEIELAGERQRLTFLETRLKEIQNELKENPFKASSPLAEELQKKLIALEYKYSSLILKGYPPEHEEMVALVRDIETARKQLSDELDVLFEGKSPVNPFDEINDIGTEIALVRTNIAELEAESSTVSATRERTENDLNLLPEQEFTLASLVREEKANEEIYLMLLEKREEARITEAEVVGNARVFSRAKPPVGPISPNKKQSIFLGLLTGFLWACGIVSLLEYFDRTIRTPSTFKTALSAPILGVIPLEPKPRVRALKHGSLRTYKLPVTELNNRYPVMIRSPQGAVADSYRGLRVRFQHRLNDNNGGHSIIVVTAASPREGKTTVTVNLAISLAQIGKKVCLIDADTVKPSIGNGLGLKPAYGYSDLLRGDTTLDEVMLTDLIPGLSVIPGVARSSDDTELTGNGSFKGLVKELHGYGFDYIILDAPPLLPLADALNVAEHIDGYLLVSRSGVVDPSTVAYCEELIKQVGSTVIGGVLNCVDPEDLYGGYGRYHYYYYYRTSETVDVNLVETSPRAKRRGERRTTRALKSKETSEI
jgi:succinoglycan biosynthesis transport protein ExoP